MRVNWVCCEEGGAGAALRLRGLTQPESEVKSETNILYMSQHISREGANLAECASLKKTESNLHRYRRRVLRMPLSQHQTWR
ncbi:hypothetical protein CgunFtcFv8_014912 [Champsocephalus gunnari]|uniref:Uncharacterized protein n=1 Tax=Champsocephalus gunnari TaxID=52237 RepID=A0AAN8E9A6_CHAGU|nr:hypothetical protein CgunFtcFv8_014912 [Champsocephalus gunnari]